MLAGFFIILHLLAGDLKLPPVLHDPLVAWTQQFVPAPTTPVHALTLASAGPDALVPQPAPLPVRQHGSTSFKAKASRAIVLDADTATVMFEKNADQPASMASIAKLMVALQVLHDADSLDQVLVVPKDVSALDPVSSVAGFKPGETATVRSLMTALLVASANDAAVTLAVGLAGSEDKFVTRMNERAEAMGLAHTSFANATGLDERGNKSTARDLAFLLLAAQRQPLIQDFTTLHSTSVSTEEGNTYFLKPTDKLLGSSNDFTITAGKTGTTDDAGASFVVAAERDGRHVIAVILDSPDRFTEAQAALHFAFDSYTWPSNDGTRMADQSKSLPYGG